MGVTIVTIGVLAFIALGVASVCLWDDLDRLRNLVLIVGTPLAIGLAVWRSIVAQQQVEATQAALLSDQYQRAVKMLESEQGFIRMGGIRTLYDIAMKHDEYRMEAGVLLENYGRNLDTSKDGEGEEWDMAEKAFSEIQLRNT